eukprot:TRINITY_DN1526_c0_g1_i1.p1 TRINITY_DN1526_c0_g1~~TRINITY_DN1526_c0_g1_i1.p1  ORF type:complete len:373 (-),score=71.75 TRINITY_DN1526_c0_g1_i1:267-1385(-)
MVVLLCCCFMNKKNFKRLLIAEIVIFVSILIYFILQVKYNSVIEFNASDYEETSGKNAKYLILEDGRILEYFDFGEQENYENVIVLNHGGLVSGYSTQAKDIDDILKENKLRAISPTLPGFGFSDRDENLTLNSFAKDIVFLLNHLNILPSDTNSDNSDNADNNICVCGFSFGSMTSLAVGNELIKNSFPIRSLALLGAPTHILDNTDLNYEINQRFENATFIQRVMMYIMDFRFPIIQRYTSFILSYLLHHHADDFVNLIEFANPVLNTNEEDQKNLQGIAVDLSRSVSRNYLAIHDFTNLGYSTVDLDFDKINDKINKIIISSGKYDKNAPPEMQLKLYKLLPNSDFIEYNDAHMHIVDAFYDIIPTFCK